MISILKNIFGQKEIIKVQDKKIKALIFAKGVFSLGWNDPSEILETENSIVLDVVFFDEAVNDKVNYWNKKYYDSITAHYSLSESQLEQISAIISIDPDKYRELYAFWPKKINIETYNKLFEKIKLNFVQATPISDELKDSFAIVLNEQFWNIPTHNSNVLVDIINTYERSFSDFELFHESSAVALKYGLIIYDRLCLERPPESIYYYHEEIKKQLGQAIEIPTFNYNSSLYKLEDKKAEYDRIINERGDELKYIENIFEKLDTKPFKLIKVIS